MYQSNNQRQPKRTKLKTPTVVASVLTVSLLAAATAATFVPNSSVRVQTVAPCASDIERDPWTVPTVFTNEGPAGLEAMIRRLEPSRAIFIGEVHDRPEHHRSQLELICRLHERGTYLAIGVEFFQQPFQAYLDDYIAGRLEERDLLRLTDYERRWGYDFELYAPILRFARQNAIPLVALNVPTELTKAVAKRGLQGLSDAQRDYLPAHIDRSNAAYAQRLKAVFEAHPKSPHSRFEHFLDAQLLWDEGMAATAADYLSKHPERKMVVLAGNGHVAWRSGIPARLSRRLDIGISVISQATKPRLASRHDADFLRVQGAAPSLLAGLVATGGR